MKRLAQLSMTLLVVILLSPYAVANARPAGALITVDTSNDSDLPDNELSLREAIGLANGARIGCFTTHEKLQAPSVNWVPAPPWPSCGGTPSDNYPRYNVSLVNPNVGIGYADSIVFTSTVGTISLSTPLPPLGINDNIDGNGGSFGGKVRLLGSGPGSGSGNGLEVYENCLPCDPTSNQIVNLVIQGFPGDGIQIVDMNVNGVVLQGLEIDSNGGSGIAIVTDYYANPRNMQIGGASISQRNVIYCNSLQGISLTGTDGADSVTDFSNTIQNNYIGIKSNGSTKCANVQNGIDMISMRGNTLSSNYIGGNGRDGIRLSGPNAINNQLLANAIGIDTGGSINLGNGLNGITLASGASNNQVGNLDAGNTIFGNLQSGILVYGSGTSGNQIAYNQIGTVFSNTIGVQIVVSATNNTLLQNTISRNATYGVLLDGSDTMSNTVIANRIGTNFAGNAARPNGASGVQIQNGARANVIGLAGLGNLISGNTGDGVRLTGSGTNFNVVYANTIGLDTSETAKVPNGGSGVSVLGGASGNRVGGAGKGNTIAGNGDAGVLINGTLATFVFGNRIGTNAVSAAGLGNTNAGVGLFDGAAFNHIGNTAADFEGAGNIISGNGGAGVDLGGIDVRYNDIFNNEIGTNDVGTTGLPNALGGVRLFGQATNNFIGSPGQGNLISGNSGAGVTLSNAGTATNTVSSNIIGTNLAGKVISNTLQGIVIQSMAASNIITGNLVSGNGADGILIHDGGTNFNVVSNNAVGTNYAGTEALANQYSGVAIINGPYSTLVGGPTLGDRNYISGNGTYGVYIAGASTINTYVSMNFIGPNEAGTAAVPNGAAGVAILAAQDTVLDQDQYISGNARQGIYTDAANNTRIAASNRIGLASDGLSPMGNGLQGIVLNNTTNTHVVAIVRYNGATGIAVTGASANNNRVQPYIDRDNGRLPIDLNADGFTPNDPGDTDSGPNGLLNYPVITATSSSVISGTACANCTVLV